MQTHKDSKEKDNDDKQYIHKSDFEKNESAEILNK